MIALKAATRTMVAAGLAMALAGCVTVFPKEEPTQLYRFGAPSTAAGQERADQAQAGPATGSVGLLKPASSFAKAVAGDRILSINGAEAAYIAGARWVSPASALFDEAVAQAFDADTGAVRLVGRGEAARADYVMRIDVRNFEAAYDHGPKAAPTVVVRAHAVLTRTQDRALVAEKLFEVRIKAPGNRVGLIVSTFDAAVAQLLSQLVTWSNVTATPVTR